MQVILLHPGDRNVTDLRDDLRNLQWQKLWMHGLGEHITYSAARGVITTPLLGPPLQL